MGPVVSGNCKLYCGDCQEMMPGLLGVEAVVTDPPYGLGRRWTGGTWFTRNVYENDSVDWDNEAPDL